MRLLRIGHSDARGHYLIGPEKADKTADMFQIWRFAAHKWPTCQNLRLRALADSPDAFGRTLAEAQEYADDY
jgi:hypothetical protein